MATTEKIIKIAESIVTKGFITAWHLIVSIIHMLTILPGSIIEMIASAIVIILIRVLMPSFLINVIFIKVSRQEVIPIAAIASST